MSIAKIPVNIITVDDHIVIVKYNQYQVIRIMDLICR